MRILFSLVLVAISMCSYSQQKSCLDSVSLSFESFKYNTQKSEINPSIIGNKLFFSSLQVYDSMARNKSHKYYDFVVCHLGEKGFVSSYREARYKSSKYHDSSLCYDPIKKRYFITRSNIMLPQKSVNHFIQTKKVNELKILIYDENLTLLPDSEQLPFISDLYSVSHPSLNSSCDTLYFASNMPGGFGANDIYFSNYMDGKWSEPKNLGDSINTNKNELYPYYHKAEELFFSSNRNNGIGGLDIYSSLKMRNSFSEAKLVEKINTKYDDFGLVLSDNESFGFFSSNRKGGKGGDDLYTLQIDNLFDIHKGIVIDNITASQIPLAQVRISYLNQFLIDSLVSREKGEVEFSLPHRGLFRVTVSKYNYLDLDTIIDGRLPNFTFKLGGKIQLDILPNIYYDFDRSDLTKLACEKLDKIVDDLHKYPKLGINLSAYTDSQGSDMYNMILSKKRAQSVVNYLIKNGIPKERIRSVYYGETRLVSKMNRLNRRTEFRLFHLSK